MNISAENLQNKPSYRKNDLCDSEASGIPDSCGNLFIFLLFAKGETQETQQVILYKTAYSCFISQNIYRLIVQTRRLTRSDRHHLDTTHHIPAQLMDIYTSTINYQLSDHNQFIAECTCTNQCLAKFIVL